MKSSLGPLPAGKKCIKDSPGGLEADKTREKGEEIVITGAISAESTEPHRLHILSTAGNGAGLNL